MSEWITKTVDTLGYFGIALFMFLENIFPPIPSEIVMPAAGFGAQQGDQTFWGVVLAGTAGSLAGLLPWYLVARWIGKDALIQWVERRGRWIRVKPKEIERADKWFDRWGRATVFFCRLVPGIRTLISVPAGFAEMPFWQFFGYSAAGTLIWTSALAALGWFAGENYKTVAQITSWIGIGVIVALVGWFLVRFWSRGRDWPRKHFAAG